MDEEQQHVPGELTRSNSIETFIMFFDGLANSNHRFVETLGYQNIISLGISSLKGLGVTNEEIAYATCELFPYATFDGVMASLREREQILRGGQ